MENENKNIDEKNVVVVSDKGLTSKNKSGIYIVVGLLVLIIVGSILFAFFLKPDKNKGNENINNNNNNNNGYNNGNNIEVPTFSDDVIVDDSVEVEDKIIYIYQKGYADKGPIAYTYECESESCDLKVTEKGFILYDEDVVKYREMTIYEYEQIYNSEVSPVGGKLDKNDFVEVESIFDNARFSGYMKKIDDLSFFEYVFEESNILYKVYNIENKLYYVSGDITTFSEYKFNDNESYVVSGDFVIGTSFIYDYKTKIIVIVDELRTDYDPVKLGKIDNFTYFYVSDIGATYEFTYYTFYDKNYENMYTIYTRNGFYINNNLLYYIDYNLNLNIVNDKGEKVYYDNTNMNALRIFEDKVIYFDNDNILKVKSLINDEILYSSDIKLEGFNKNFDYNIIDLDDGYEIYYDNTFIIDEEKFDEFRKKQNITDKQISLIKKCLSDYETCDIMYKLGYKIKLNKKGELISKNYYVEVYD